MCSTTTRPTGTRPRTPDGIPKIDSYYDGSSTPTPEAIDFTPGDLLGSVPASRAAQLPRGARAPAHGHVRQGRARLGLRAGAAGGGDRHLPAVLAGVPDGRADRQGAEPQARRHGRDRLDHVDLQAAIDRGLTVAEVSYSNSISVSEHVVMMTSRSSGTTSRRTRSSSTAAGTSPTRSRARTTWRACRSAPSGGPHRLGGAPAGCRSRSGCTTDRHRLPSEVEAEPSHVPRPPEELVAVCDVVTINAPLHPRRSTCSTRS